MATLTVRPDRLVKVLGSVATFFVVIHLVLMTVHRLGLGTLSPRILSAFDLDMEKNFTTLFSVFLLLFAFVLLLMITWCERRGRRLPWSVLTLGFGLMAVDEAWSFHETLGLLVKKWLGGEHLGMFYFAWVVPGLVLVAVAGLSFLGFLRRLPPATRNGFLLAAALYLGGALVVEMGEGWFVEVYGRQNIVYAFAAALEEGLEMAGIIVLLRGLLNHIREHFLPLSLTFKTDQS